MARCLVFLAVGLLWWWGASLAGSPLVFPGPQAVLSRFLELQGWPLWSDVLHSGGKVLAVLFFVVFLGVPLGVLLGLNPGLYEAFRPLAVSIQAVPVVSWLGFAVFALGIGWRAPVLIAVLVFLPTALFVTVSGVRGLEREVLEMAEVYGVRGWKRWRYLYAGALAPCVRAVIETVAGGAWKAVLVAEYLCGSGGVGVRIAWARQTADVEAAYALSLLAILLGLGCEFLLRRSAEAMGRRWHLFLT